MVQIIRKIAIEIAAITFAIAALWYAFEITTFNSLSETSAKLWTRVSEWILLGSAVLLAVGLFGEWSESESWKKRGLYKLAKGAVIAGVIGELLGDAGIFEGSTRVQDISDKYTQQLDRIAMPRRWYGPTAGSVRGGPTGTALFEMMDVNSALSKFPKTPVLVQFVPEFDAAKLAGMLGSGLRTAGWQPRALLQDESGINPLSIADGVQVWTRPKPDEGWKAADALAKSLALEGIEAERPDAPIHRDDVSNALLPEGDIRKAIPPGSVVILIGEKPGFFELLVKQADEYRAAHPGEK